MQLEGVLHIPLSCYAYALGEHTLVIRLRAGKNQIKESRLFYGDRVCVNDPVDVTEVEMERIAEDGLFEYYEAKIRDSYTRVCYYFSLDDGNNRIYYGEYGFSGEIPTNRTHFFNSPISAGRISRPFPLGQGNGDVPHFSGQFCKRKAFFKG